MIQREPIDAPSQRQRTVLWLLAVFLLAALACEGTTPPPTTPAPSSKKVLLIGLDGIRTDILAQVFMTTEMGTI